MCHSRVPVAGGLSLPSLVSTKTVGEKLMWYTEKNGKKSQQIKYLHWKGWRKKKKNLMQFDI